jgi:nitroreductase
MDAIEMIKERRSIRKFQEKRVDREIMKEIVSISRFAPSWGNFQVARYTLIDNPSLIEQIANEGVHGFVYNVNTLKDAPGIVVLSYAKGKSGKLDKIKLQTSKEERWELFDAGIACQTFCLAAHEKGVGTLIMGVINTDAIAKIVNLPADETVAALIVYGYEEVHPEAPLRKSVEDLLRIVE